MMIPRTPEFLAAQDRVKVSHFTRQGFDLGTVIHAGANSGLEAVYYLLLGSPRVLLFEPLPLALMILRGRFAHEPRISIFPFALSDQADILGLGVTGDTGKGSSFLADLDPHAVPRGGIVPAPLLRFDTLDLHTEFTEMWTNTLVVDVQGMEMQVLKGFGEMLSRFSFLNIELSAEPLYEGGAPGQEVVDWLDKQGFAQDSPLLPHEDVFFIRKGLK